jgi:hypothetical protein
MGNRSATALLIAVALLVAACSDEKEAVPAGCRQGPDAVRTALRDAPAEVTIDGSSLSECIKDTSGGGELQEIGITYLDVASGLADGAAKEPNGEEALQLGYLVGAFERSKAGAQGVGYELGRRLHSELLRVDHRSPAFRRGERAGRSGG